MPGTQIIFHASLQSHVPLLGNFLLTLQAALFQLLFDLWTRVRHGLHRVSRADLSCKTDHIPGKVRVNICPCREGACWCHLSWGQSTAESQSTVPRPPAPRLHACLLGCGLAAGTSSSAPSIPLVALLRGNDCLDSTLFRAEVRSLQRHAWKCRCPLNPENGTMSSLPTFH